MKPLAHFFFLVLLCSAAQAADPNSLAPALELFQRGAYPQSIKAAEKVKPAAKGAQAEWALFLATAYAKMQAFDKALTYYQQAEALQSPAPNLHYDYGQALFANRQLKESEAQFKKSIVKKFKPAASAYYVGYLRQLQEDPEGARDFYQRIQRLSADPDAVKQPALYQIAELEAEKVNALGKAERSARISRDVIPLYKHARDFAGDTPTHEQAQAKIDALEAELEANVARMRNGNPLPRQAYTLRLTEDFSYDSNVITEADGALVQVSDRDSFVSRTGVLAKYQFNSKRRFSFIPEFNGSLTWHTNRGAPRVYQNDNIVLAPALRTKWEHWSGGKAATGLYDLEFNLMLRDYEQRHAYPFYTRYLNLMVGERVNWFAFGSTTAKLSLKLTENYNPERSAITPQFSLQQNVKIYGRYDLQNTFTMDYLRARNDYNDEKNYKVRSMVTLTKLFEKVDVTPSLGITWKDTMKQAITRGTEVLVNPSASLTREFGRRLDGTFEYAFSKNYSKSKDLYQYTKHELKIGAGYRF